MTSSRTWGRYSLVTKRKGLIPLSFQNLKPRSALFFKSYQYFGRCVKRCCSKSFLLITSYPSVRETTRSLIPLSSLAAPIPLLRSDSSAVLRQGLKQSWPLLRAEFDNP